VTIFEYAAQHSLKLEERESYNPGHSQRYELFAPDGMRFIEGIHSFLMWDAADVRDQIRELVKQYGTVSRYLEPCPDDCECKEVVE
jgi:hypothetical protein